jgi:hypothetical protein
MPAAIKDEFSDLPISKEQRYWLRLKRDKRCRLCGEPAASCALCLEHLVRNRERAREIFGYKRRYSHTLGYELELKAKAPVQWKRSKEIRDEIWGLPVSRQRKVQLRWKREGRCQCCGKPIVSGSRCLKHLIANREWRRKQLGCKRRKLDALSYRLEARAQAAAPTTPSKRSRSA